MTVPKDDNRFRYLSPEPAPHELGIPPDYKEPLDLRTAREIAGERRRWLESTDVCPHCGGRGRVPKS